jgi:hypothetical protein
LEFQNPTTMEPLAIPPYLADVPRFEISTIPTNITLSKSSDCSDMFADDWLPVDLPPCE